MSFRTILLSAALTVVALWPQGLVLCVAPGDHTGVEHPSSPPCGGERSDCEDIDSPTARVPARPAPLPPAATPSPADDPSTNAGGTDLPLLIAPDRAAPPAPPVLPVLTI